MKNRRVKKESLFQVMIYLAKDDPGAKHELQVYAIGGGCGVGSMQVFC